jgi:uncharacterized protein
VVKVHQKVMVTVLDVDLQRRRVSLSLRDSQSRVDANVLEPVAKGQPKINKKKVERFSNNPFAVLKDRMN